MSQQAENIQRLIRRELQPIPGGSAWHSYVDEATSQGHGYGRSASSVRFSCRADAEHNNNAIWHCEGTITPVNRDWTMRVYSYAYRGVGFTLAHGGTTCGDEAYGEKCRTAEAHYSDNGRYSGKGWMDRLVADVVHAVANHGPNIMAVVEANRIAQLDAENREKAQVKAVRQAWKVLAEQAPESVTVNVKKGGRYDRNGNAVRALFNTDHARLVLRVEPDSLRIEPGSVTGTLDGALALAELAIRAVPYAQVAQTILTGDAHAGSALFALPPDVQVMMDQILAERT
jgi:hypothetical protein